MSAPPRVSDRPPPYGSVVFDCDSTLSAIEGIDELATLRPQAADEVRALTERSMAGELPLEAVYGARLAAIRPTRNEVEELGAAYVRAALPGARELVSALGALGKRVAIVSGGLLGPVRTLAATLGVDPELVFAVAIRHGADGAYAGFDEDSPLVRAGGKLDLLRELAARPTTGALALVGDGATDLEAAPVCARFVAFGGVARRAAVFAAATVASEAQDLRDLFPLLTTAAERARLAADPAHATLLHPSRGT